MGWIIFHWCQPCILARILSEVRFWVLDNGTNFQLWCTLYAYGQCRFTMALWWLFKSTLRCVKYIKVSNDIVHTLNIIIYATQNSTSAISKVESYILFRNSPVFEEEVVCSFFLWPFFFCPSSIYGFWLFLWYLQALLISYLAITIFCLHVVCNALVFIKIKNKK